MCVCVCVCVVRQEVIDTGCTGHMSRHPIKLDQLIFHLTNGMLVSLEEEQRAHIPVLGKTRLWFAEY